MRTTSKPSMGSRYHGVMPRRAAVRTACEPCRKSRAKCDGETPCVRCHNNSLECNYNRSKAVSKESLRVEIKRLQYLIFVSDTLLEAIVSDSDSVVTDFIVESLRNGADPEDIAQRVHRMKADRAHSSAGGSPSLENDATHGELTPTSSQDSIRPSTASVMNGDNYSPLTTCNTQSSALSSPVDPLGPVAEAPASRFGLSSLNPNADGPWTDTWTKLGWPKSRVRELVGLVLETDGMLFCLIWKDLFLRDFDNGGTQYCSAALVNALITLVTRIKQEEFGVNQSLQFYQQRLSRRGDEFFAEALELLQKNGGLPNNLADAQALGVLALYEANSDREAETQKLADEFATAMTQLYLHESSSQLKDEVYMRVRTSTYCGSLSLLRTLRLSQALKHQNSDILKRPPGHLGLLEENHTIRRLIDSLDSHTQAGVGTQANAITEPQRLAAKVFQLVEWTYILRVQPVTPDFRETVGVYIKCLEWYNDIFHSGDSHSNSHFTRFAHMLYHFCILQILSPFVNLPKASHGSIQPREICHQAAQNILSLAVAHHPKSGPRQSLGLTRRFTSEAMTYMTSKDRTPKEASDFAELLTNIQNLGVQIDTMRMPTQRPLPQLLPQPPQARPGPPGIVYNPVLFPFAPQPLALRWGL